MFQIISKREIIQWVRFGKWQVCLRTGAVFVFVFLLSQNFARANDRAAQSDLSARPSDTVKIKEVLVESKLSKAIQQKSALNTRVVESDFLKEFQGGSLAETLSHLPGMDLISIGATQGKPLIRGLGFDRMLVVDRGIKHEAQQWGLDHGLELDPFAIDRMEIVKGPASYRFGSNAIGGLLHVLPAPVPREGAQGGSISLVGRSNNASLGASVSAYKRLKDVYIRATISSQSTADYRVPVDTVYVYDAPVPLYKNRVRNTASNQFGTHLEVGFLLNEFKTSTTLSYWLSKGGFFANAHGLEPRNVDVERYDRDARDRMQPSDRVSHFKWIQRSSWRKNQHYFEMDLGYQENARAEYSVYIPHGYMPLVLPTAFRKNGSVERAYYKKSLNFSLYDSFSWRKHRLQGGFQSDYQRNEIDGFGFLIPAHRQFTAAAFLTDEWAITDQFALHSSIRYDHVQLKISPYQDWFASPLNADPDAEKVHLVRVTSMEKSFNSLSGGLGVVFFAEQNSLKLNLGRSFRTPSPKELVANGVNYHYFSFEQGNPTLQPEISYQFDVDYSFKNSSWELQLSPFFQYFPNYIYLNPTADYDYSYGAGNQVFKYVQSAVQRYGGELLVGRNWGDQFRVTGSFNYLYAIQRSGSKAGFSLPFSPPASMQFVGTYSLPGFKLVNRSYLSVEFQGVAAQNRIVPPEKKTKAYQVVHLRAGGAMQVGSHELDVTLQLNNLLKTTYFKHTSFYRIIGMPEPGLNASIQVKYAF